MTRTSAARRPAPLLALGVGGASLLLSGCVTLEPGATDATPREPVDVTIGTTFTDDSTGDVVTIESARRHNPSELYEAANNPDGEMVYLEVSVVEGEQYTYTVEASDFFLVSEGEEVDWTPLTSDEEASGLTPLDSAPVEDGARAGYVPIYIRQTAATLQGVYVRPEVPVLGTDDVLPEFRAEFTIPAA